MGQGRQCLKAETLADLRGTNQDDSGGRDLIDGGILQNTQLCQRSSRSFIGFVQDQQVNRTRFTSG